MLSKTSILNLYKKYNVQASKEFGQNFLYNNEIIQKIIIGSQAHNQDIVEIGPGLGSLTQPLLKVVKTLAAYEIDEDMISVLEGEIKDKRFNLIKQNFLEAKFNWTGEKVIVANIPYNITSDILFKILKNTSKFSSATLMVQKEVGERLLATSKKKQYGKLSVTTQLMANIKKIVDVPASSFVPEPKVESIVIKLDFTVKNFDLKLMNFIKSCFAYQRKTLVNNLIIMHKKEAVLKVLEHLNLKLNIRPQEISPKVFLQIYKLLYN